jgi:dipeptidyl aminopeptidase/acylaminoacyl peptidase
VLRHSLASLAAILTCVGSAPGQTGCPNNLQNPRPVTVADTICMTKLGDPEYSVWGASSRGRVAQFSPDGTKFIVVFRKGNLEKNTNEYSILLWQTEGIFRSSAPDVLLTMSSSSNRPAIQKLKWLPDNETFVFLGENPGEQAQLYSFSLRTQALRKLSNDSASLLAFDLSPDGRHLAYIADSPVENLWDDKGRRDGVQISTQRLESLIAGRKENEQQLFFQTENGFSRGLVTRDRIGFAGVTTAPVVSPDGKYIALLLHPSELPANWQTYSDYEMKRTLAAKRPPGEATAISRWELIDTETGQVQPLLNAPQWEWSTEAVWSPDSHSIAIANTYLPLDGVSGKELDNRKSTKFAVEVRVPGGDITPISQENLRLISWNSKSNELVLQPGSQDLKSDLGNKVIFRKVAGVWQKQSETTPEASKPDIVLEEDMNSRPKLFAIDRKSQRRALLLDLNPQFSHLKFGRVEEITWNRSDGIQIKGGLYYPVDYHSGKKYPLVIQTHWWTPEKFWIDGPWTTAFAAQPLAGQNIMVLQTEKWTVNDRWWAEVWDTPEEPKKYVETYEKAIDYLDEKGLIDRNRVGIIGFSRTGFYVKYALTHSSYHLTAASVTDSFDGGYFQYVAFSNSSPGLAEEDEAIRDGAKPYGQGLRKWMDLSPGFNLDRVRTPLLITALNPGSVLGEWEWFAGLTRLGKPVAMVMMEDGLHELQKPWQRMISQQGNVDWFTFWLKSEEDPDPAKAEKYARWRELRKLQLQSSPNPQSSSGRVN